MALTARQRNALPRAAFAIAPKGSPRSAWKYPVPTRAHARAAGIPEGQRQRTLAAAKSFAGRRSTAGSFRQIAPVANRRAAQPIRATRGALPRGRR